MKPEHKTKNKSLFNSRGVTLIELLTAMVISLVVLLAVGTVYLSTKRSYNVQDEFAKMQENALFAFQFITQDLSQAGFAGCSPIINNLLNTTAVTDGLFNFTDGIYGWEYTGTGPGTTFNIASMAPAPAGSAGSWADNTLQQLHTSLAGLVVPGTDIVVIKSSTERSALVPTADIKPSDTSITFATPTLMPQGTVILVSDCLKADLFMNSDSVGDTTLSRGAACGGYLPCNKAGANFSHEYKMADVRMITTTSRAYFIGQGTNGEPALFRFNYNLGIGGPAPEELVEGVENMQILYGEDLDGGTFAPTRYVPINGVTNLANVVSVRISLLMRSPGETNRPPDTRTFLLGGTNAATGATINPIDDRHMRKVFTSTIVLRNKQVTGRG